MAEDCEERAGGGGGKEEQAQTNKQTRHRVEASYM